MPIMTLWFTATGVFIAGALIWGFAPVLIPFIALTLGLALLVGGIVALARWYERRRGTQMPPAHEPE